MTGDKSNLQDPASDLLVATAYPELAAALRATSNDIISAWESSALPLVPAERKLNETQLRDHLPQILKLVGDLLAEDDPAEARKLINTPVQHGAMRFEQRYDISQFIIEYRLLRRALVSVVERQLNRRLRTEEDLALDMAIDVMLQRGIVAFVNYQQQRLAGAVEAEKKYLSFLSHDLRNNLNAVIMELEVLKRRLAKAPGFEDAAADLDLAQHSVLETVDGMDRLLETERLRKRGDPVISTVGLVSLTAEVARRFQRRADEKGLKLVTEVEPGATIQSDREWLTLALQNLVGNAVKFSSSGTVTVRCGRLPASEGAGWIISVADQGPGIAPERLKEIFRMFSRGETHGQAGVGLGLAVAAQAAKLLGAQLNVRSELGVGSTFELLFSSANAAQS